MGDRYFLKLDGCRETEVTRSEFIKYERRAGFQPKMSSDDPHYMDTLATSGFGANGVRGRIEFNEGQSDG